MHTTHVFGLRRLAPMRGFTLIEVMITVAIIGILAAVAYPSYRDYVVRGQLVDATTALSSYKAEMERHYQDNRTFATVGSFVTPCARGSDPSRRVNNFQISCDGAPTADTYSVQAVGSGPVAGFVFKINEKKVDDKTTAAPAGYGNCTGNNWITKKGQPCS